MWGGARLLGVLLTIDTSTPVLVVGLVRASDMPGGRGPVVEVLATREIEDCRQHNELLVPMVLAVVAEAGVQLDDVAGVVVGCGPGPFTGLRVGMASAMALADALGVECVGVRSLDAIAVDALRGVPDVVDARSVLVVTDARRREGYWARYECGGGLPRLVEGPEVSPPAEIVGEVDVLCVPDGAWEQKVGARGRVVVGRPSASALAELAVGGVTVDVVPLYLRRPDAQVPKAMR